MDKILFLSDLHGNMVATQAMAEEIERIRPNLIWFLGDAVGKGPENHKTCDWVRNNCDRFLAGNWDTGLCSHWREGIKDDFSFYDEQIGEERFLWLESLPLESEILISGTLFRLVHGRPIDQLYFGYDQEDKLSKGFVSSDGKKTYGGLICGDSHMPFVRDISLGYALNTGSVGNSLGVPKAHALLVEGILDGTEPSPVRMTVLSVPYDNRKAASIADEYPELPDKEAFKNEVMTGKYSR